jgi:hypothetical protein
LKRCSIPFETLADYNDGRADERSAALVREHLAAGCAHCVDGIAWLRHVADTMQEAQRVQPPQRLVSRLHGLYAQRFRMPARRSLLARLTFDGRSARAFVGARGVEQAALRQNFSTDAHDIEIWQEPIDQGNWYLIGQVLPREGDEVIQPGEVVFTAANGEGASVTPELPEFHLPSIPAGVYTVSVKLDDADIVIPDLTVGPGAD